MTSQPDIALFTVSFLFLMGITQAGVVFTSMLRLVKSDWGKPWYRLAELSTLAFFPLAIVGYFVIIWYGSDELFYWLDPAPDEHISSFLNLDWLIIRNVVSMIAFYVIAWICTKKSLDADRGAADHDETEKSLYLWAPILLLAFVLTNTFVAWDFGMMLIPHFHSTIFPIHIWFGNVFAGSAAMIAIVVVMKRVDGGGHFGQDSVKSLGMLVTGFTLMWLYFFWAQFFVIWFGNLPQETGPVWRQMYGHYGPFFWTMIAGCFFLPFVLLLFAVVKRSVLAMCLIALGINIGIWINKYLMIVPVFSADHRPFNNWIDILLAVGLLAGFLIVLLLLAKRLPIYSSWEMSRES